MEYCCSHRVKRLPKTEVFTPFSAPLVRRAKLGFVDGVKVPILEALARHQELSVALVSVTKPAKRTQGGDGPQCESVKGMSLDIRINCGCRRR